MIDLMDPMDPTTKQFFRDLLEGQYLAKFIRLIELGIVRRPPPPWRIPIPQQDPPPFRGDPHPEPNLSVDVRDVLLGDLLISALGDPEPAPNRPLIVNQIRESNLHVEVVESLQRQFKDGLASLDAELDVFKKHKAT